MPFDKHFVAQPFTVVVSDKDTSVKMTMDKGIVTVASQMLPEGSAAELFSKKPFSMELRRTGPCSFCLSIFKDGMLPISSYAISGLSVRSAVLNNNYEVRNLDKIAHHIVSRALPKVEKEFGTQNLLMQHLLANPAPDTVVRFSSASLPDAGWQTPDACEFVLKHNAKALAFFEQKLQSRQKARAAVTALRLFSRTLHTASNPCVFDLDTQRTHAYDDFCSQLDTLFRTAGDISGNQGCLIKWPGYAVICLQTQKSIFCRGLDTHNNMHGKGFISISPAVKQPELDALIAAGSTVLARTEADFLEKTPKA